MLRQSRATRWWPLAACFVMAFVLLGIEAELPVAPAWHMAVQVAIVVLIYGLMAWWCYVDDHDHIAKAALMTQRDLARRREHAAAQDEAGQIATPVPVADRRSAPTAVKLRPVPMARRSGSDSATERKDYHGF